MICCSQATDKVHEIMKFSFQPLTSRFGLTTTPTIVTNDLVTTFRFNHLGRKRDARYTTPDIFKEIAVVTLADNMTEAEVADIVFGRTQANRVEQVAIPFYLKYILNLLNIRDCNAEGIKFVMES